MVKAFSCRPGDRYLSAMTASAAESLDPLPAPVNRRDVLSHDMGFRSAAASTTGRLVYLLGSHPRLPGLFEFVAGARRIVVSTLEKILRG